LLTKYAATRFRVCLSNVPSLTRARLRIRGALSCHGRVVPSASRPPKLDVARVERHSDDIVVSPIHPSECLRIVPFLQKMIEFLGETKNAAKAFYSGSQPILSNKTSKPLIDFATTMTTRKFGTFISIHQRETNASITLEETDYTIRATLDLLGPSKR
jgi:hypothetical protein